MIIILSPDMAGVVLYTAAAVLEAEQQTAPVVAMLAMDLACEPALAWARRFAMLWT